MNSKNIIAFLKSSELLLKLILLKRIYLLSILRSINSEIFYDESIKPEQTFLVLKPWNAK